MQLLTMHVAPRPPDTSPLLGTNIIKHSQFRGIQTHDLWIQEAKTHAFDRATTVIGQMHLFQLN
jgi:hypothetical protein